MTGKRFKMSVARTKATGIILEHELSTDEVYNLLMDYKEENEQLKQEIKELKEELIEYIEQTSSDKSNKKGVVGNGRFA